MATAKLHARPAAEPEIFPGGGPQPKRIVNGRLAPARDLVFDLRLSCVSRLILGSLNDYGPAESYWSAYTDDEIAEKHGVRRSVVQATLRAGEVTGWVWRMTQPQARYWFHAIGRPELYDDLPPMARHAKRLVILLDRLTDLLDRSGPPPDPGGVHLSPRRQVHLPPPRELACAPIAHVVAPGRELASPRELSRASSRAPDTALEEKKEKDLLPLPPNAPDGTPHRSDAEIAQWEIDALQATGDRKRHARMMLSGLAADRARAAEPSPPPPTERVPSRAVAEAPAPAPPAAVPPRSPLPPQFVPRCRRIVAGMESPDGREAAVESLYAFVSRAFGVKGAATPEIWLRRIRWLAGSEAGRVALLEMLAAAARPWIKDREHYLAKSLANEWAISGPVKKPTPGSTRLSSPGAGLDRIPTAAPTIVHGGSLRGN